MAPRSGRPSWIRWWAAAARVTSGLGAGGTVLGSVVSTIPEVVRITIPMSLPVEHGPPAEVQFVGALPACAP